MHAPWQPHTPPSSVNVALPPRCNWTLQVTLCCCRRFSFHSWRSVDFHTVWLWTEMTKLAKSDKIRSEIQECIPVGCVPPAAVAIGGGGVGGLHQATVMAFWCGGLVMAFCPPPRPYQKATFNQKATKPEGHNRRPLPPPPQGADPPGPGATTPPPRPAVRHAGISPAMHAGIVSPRGQNHRRL